MIQSLLSQSQGCSLSVVEGLLQTSSYSIHRFSPIVNDDQTTHGYVVYPSDKLPASGDAKESFIQATKQRSVHLIIKRYYKNRHMFGL